MLQVLQSNTSERNFFAGDLLANVKNEVNTQASMV